MELNEAKAFMAASHEVNSYLNNAAEIVDSITDADVQKKMRWELGQAMSKIYLGLMRPIIQEFPELDPDLAVDDDASAPAA